MPVAEDGSTVNASFNKTPVPRDLASAVRQMSDATNARIAATANSKQVVCQVSAVTAGAASDGNAVVLLLWRGNVVKANGYAAAYTPVNGHYVVCDYIDNQLFVAYRVIGQP